MIWYPQNERHYTHKEIAADFELWNALIGEMKEDMFELLTVEDRVLMLDGLFGVEEPEKKKKKWTRRSFKT